MKKIGRLNRYHVVQGFAAVCFASLPLVLLPQIVEQRSGTDNIKSQKLSVARLTVPGKETAAAICVGKDKHNAYFATAHHAVADLSATDSVELRFNSSPQPIPARVFNLFNENPDVDLAIILIPVGELPEDYPALRVKEVISGAQVRIIGHPSATGWSVWQGYIQDENVSNLNQVQFSMTRDRSILPGYSGGPVFDSKGNLLGMHMATKHSSGIALKATEILTQVKAWHIPTNNLLTAEVNGIAPGVDQRPLGTSIDFGDRFRINYNPEVWRADNSSLDVKFSRFDSRLRAVTYGQTRIREIGRNRERSS